jgi:threonine dehydrogenase-like Zn-dependent dehydrogenase
VLALVTTPGLPRTAEVVALPDPVPAAGEVLVRTLEVGVCGTDREIAEGLFGAAPRGERRLVLGHELLGVVERDAHGLARGQLVTATVRRSCGRCAACSAGGPDACLTGDYAERGITRLDGFARELVAESPEHLVPIPDALGRLGVLAEPASVCARALRHARAVGHRQPWEPRRALVLGSGAIGMLATCLLRLDGFAVWTAARAAPDTPKARLAAALGATYASVAETPPEALARDVGGFDVVLEATGDAEVMLGTLGLLARNGVACLLGLDARPGRVALERRVVGVDAVLGNRALVGSVNAHRDDWVAAVAALARARRRWPGVLEAFVGLRVPVDRFEDAFAFPGVKATLAFDVQ